MIQLSLLVMALGGLVILRWLVLLIIAEWGRKKDLVKHMYRHETAYRIAILIPYLDGTQAPGLMALLGALHQQDYPKSNMVAHIITTQEHALGLPHPEQLPSFVKIWTHPDKPKHHPQSGHYVAWLIERLLAAGGPPSLFVMMEANDIVRSDFLKNITTRAMESAVFQGYLALKRPMKGMFGLTYSLALRLMNRIENAGGFHLGLSCKLLSSGWVIRQELLEKIPYEKGIDVDNLEYTLRLNTHGYPVQWAPNVVVYKEDRVTFEQVLAQLPLVVLNHGRLLVQYFFPTLFKGLLKVNFSLIDEALSLILPSMSVLAFITALGLFSAVLIPQGHDHYNRWVMFTLAFSLVQLSGLAVARCRFRDILLAVVALPAIHGAACLLFPVYVLKALGARWFKSSSASKGSRIGLGKRMIEGAPKTQPRQDVSATFEGGALGDAEGRDSAAAGMVQMRAAGGGASTLSPKEEQDALLADLDATFADPIEVARHSQVLAISNGANTVEGTVHQITKQTPAGLLTYQAIFEYKGLSFASQGHPSQEAAMSELTDRLDQKGFKIQPFQSDTEAVLPTVIEPAQAPV